MHPVMWISEIKIIRIKVDSKLSHMSKSNVRLFVSIYYGAKRGKSKLGEAEFGHYENTRLWFMFDEINIETRSEAIKYFYLEPLKPFLFVCVPHDESNVFTWICLICWIINFSSQTGGYFPKLMSNAIMYYWNMKKKSPYSIYILIVSFAFQKELLQSSDCSKGMQYLVTGALLHN